MTTSVRVSDKLVDPKLFSMASSTKLRQVGANQFDIIIQRKSRIIMKDGEGILTKAKKIKEQVPNAKGSGKNNFTIYGAQV